LYIESLALARDSGDWHQLSLDLVGLAAIASEQAMLARAAYLLGAVELLLETNHTQLIAVELVEYEQVAAVARAQLDEAAFTAAWTAGRNIPLEQLITLVIDEEHN
jgi:hypothetical protein